MFETEWELMIVAFVIAGEPATWWRITRGKWEMVGQDIRRPPFVATHWLPTASPAKLPEVPT